jgi:hypothetical protein
MPWKARLLDADGHDTVLGTGFLQRFACARLSQPCLSESPDVSATFTTVAFDNSSLRWPEIST